ncbi:AraC family transcriptional regulator [Streptomyces sp. NPDC092369]|uniref:AraC family transcriptional regulator n=1 Tax=Streptomyces sp. NPDC092369 TaxID=3366015 RepID=UPI00380FECFE
MLVRASTIETLPQEEVHVSTYRPAELGPVHIGEVVFTDEMKLKCEDVGTGYYIHIPISGHFRSSHMNMDMVSDRQGSALYRPGGALTACWPTGYRGLCVRIDPQAVNATVASLVSDRSSSRVAFDPVMSFADGFGRNWAQLLLFANRQIMASDGLLSQPLVAAPLADSIVTGFVLASTRTHSETPGTPVGSVRSRAVRSAIDLIESAPGDPLTLTGLADHCGVSPRTLQKAFQLQLDMSPMQYLREVRLRRAHEELRSADPSTSSVAVIARRWGFTHLGRFAALHEAKFHQKPLRTLLG